MSCASCASRIEKSVLKVQGVTNCTVSLLTNSMLVEGSAKPSAIINAVQKAGYGAQKKSIQKNTTDADLLQDTETPLLLKRLLWSIGFLCALMYISMGHKMFGFPLPLFFNENNLACALLELLLCVVVMVINQRFFINGFKALFHFSPNMDTLVSLGSTAAFLYSTYSVFIMTFALYEHENQIVNECFSNLYFDSSAMILTLITVGKLLEARAKGKTTNALKSLINLSPKTATIIREEKEVVVQIDEVQKGDIFVVYPGQNIPVDGIVIEGSTAVNEAAITGESIPVNKIVGSKVTSATINQEGFIKCRASRVGDDTTISQIIRLVRDVSETKAPVAKIADKVSGFFVPCVMIIAFCTAIVWLCLGREFSFALSRAISVLVISCPCALGLATPVAIMVGNGVAAKHGILFKTAESLETTGKTKIIALDKTGTITTGTPVVTDVVTTNDFTQNELLTIAYSLEQKSEHPLSKAVCAFAQEKNIKLFAINDFVAIPGNGIVATREDNGKKLFAGSVKFIMEKISISPEVLQKIKGFEKQGKTPLLFVCEKTLCGLICVADTIKHDSKEAVLRLKNMGCACVMLTGDNPITANEIAKSAGIQNVIASLMPQDKAQVVKKIKSIANVMMVGDGINDAPSLASANVGVAIGSGTDIAIDSADVVLIKNSLFDVCRAIKLSRATLKIIFQNLFWAFFYNALCIPLAAGCYIKLFGLQLNPMFASLCMSLSSFCVVMNALRLNFFKIDSKKNEKHHNKILENDFEKFIKNEFNQNNFNDDFDVENSIKHKEVLQMEKTIKIDGMMCAHCEKTVQAALLAIEGITNATADHNLGCAKITLSKEVSEDAIKSVIEGLDYKYLGIE